MQDAILCEQKNDGISIDEAKKKQDEAAEEIAKKAREVSKSVKQNKIDIEKNEELIAYIRERFPKADSEVKTKIKEIMANTGITKFNDPEGTPTKPLEEIVSLL
jgi:hypothetical protein